MLRWPNTTCCVGDEEGDGHRCRSTGIDRLHEFNKSEIGAVLQDL